MKRSRINITRPHWVLAGVLLFWVHALAAQTGSPKPAKPGQRIKVVHSLEFLVLQEGENNLQKLNGRVELRQDSVFMYCDSALIQNETQVYAYHNVVIQQGDSLRVFADTLEYDGITRLAILEGNVILVNKEQKIFTDRLEYDLNTRIARYFTGATLVNDSLQLSSKRGFYYAKEQEAYFRDSVVVTDPKFSLKADTLKFNVATKTVFFLGPTILNTDSSKIYCETGYYDTQKELAQFAQNAQYLQGDQKAVADTILYDNLNKAYELVGHAKVEDSTRIAVADYIRYDEAKDQIFLKGKARYKEGAQDIQSEEINYDRKKKTYTTRGRSLIADPPQLMEADSVDFSDDSGLGYASGNVIWRDTAADYAIRCDQADYDKTRDYMKAFGGVLGRPEMTTVLDKDSLFLSSDTLIAYRPDSTELDTARRFLAYGKVRIFKSNLQAVCDSLAYSSQDSLFVLYGNPVIWSDTSQFTADTIYMWMRNDQIDRIELRQNGFILVISDGVFYNQIKGRDVLAFFENNELRQLDAEGNAEVIYYARDEQGAYVGVNQTACSEMVIRLKENQVQRITFLAEPKSKLLPMGQTDHNELRLKGFRLLEEGRPLRREDIFVYSN
ncbi:MAG: LPS-assembly protein LptD [Haliscomenobacter sp.]|nr:LPS-assembly protein LptD [Haliscomenobacter sp.]